MDITFARMSQELTGQFYDLFAIGEAASSYEFHGFTEPVVSGRRGAAGRTERARTCPGIAGVSPLSNIGSYAAFFGVVPEHRDREVVADRQGGRPQAAVKLIGTSDIPFFPLGPADRV
jgi:hypothetical protein